MHACEHNHSYDLSGIFQDTITVEEGVYIDEYGFFFVSAFGYLDLSIKVVQLFWWRLESDEGVGKEVLREGVKFMGRVEELCLREYYSIF